MSFGYPLGLVALLVVPATLAFALAVRRRPSRGAVAFTNLDVLASVVEQRRAWRPWVPLALLLLALTLAASAVAGPRIALPTRVDDATVMLLLDVSGSMEAEDVEPTRLDAATAAMRTFLARLPERYRVGLAQFNLKPTVLQRPTHERADVARAFAYLDPDEGTAIGDALATATGVVKTALAEEPARGERPAAAIVLLSDGTQNNGARPALEGAAIAERAGIPVYTVALGTDRGVVRGPGNVLLPVGPDPELMRAIAEATHAETFTAESAEQLDAVFDGLGTRIGRESRSREISSWFVFAAAAALIGALALGRIFAGALGP